jgi:serine/threonine protein kinase
MTSVVFPQGAIRIGRRIATGATAEVYEGFTSEEDPVAIKRVQQSTELLTECYRREIKAMALVCPHAHIVALLDVASVGESGCLMLELCTQGSLLSLMQKQDLTEAQVAWVVIDVSRALSHIHSKSVVHRDLRPDNVLLGNDFRLKLADFGSSAFIEELQTMSRPKLSADTYRNIFPHYQAPEQIQVTLQTTKIDIWGFGCLIYALLLQENAFSPTDQVAQLRGAYRKPRRRLSSKWRHIFDSCFQPDPSRRASAEDILNLISLDSLPQTVPIADSERSSKFSVLLDLFKSSTNSWVKAATSSHDSAPEAHYVHKLLMKVWRIPVKSQKFYASICKRPLHKTVVAVKALMLIHRYLYSGPPSVWMQDPGPTSALTSIKSQWSAEYVVSRRRELVSVDYFAALIRRFSVVLNIKVGLHISLNCRGNWTLDRVENSEQVDELLRYWKMLLSLGNGLYHSVSDLPGVRGGLAQQLLIEMMNLMTLLTRVVGQSQTEDFRQHYGSTAALITRVRKYIPNLGLPDLDLELPNVLFQSQRKVEKSEDAEFHEPSAPPLTETSVEERKSNDSFESAVSSEHFRSSSSSVISSLALNSGSQFNSLGSPHFKLPELPPLMPTPAFQGMEEVKAEGPNIDAKVLLSLEDITYGEKLGSGSSCTVFKGTYRRTVVAIKMLTCPQKFNLEFEREIAAMTGLSHPNLVLFIGAVVKPQMTIVFEYCGGDTLFRLLHQRKDVMLSWEQRLQMAKDIARGMCYLHTLQPPVLHRDLKSLNILLKEPVTTVLDPVHLKITDFGVARLLETDNEHLTGQTGTAHWMAPEVIANQRYSLAADVYSYAIVLWEICARDTPYRHLSPMLIPVKVLQARERPGLSVIPSSCPEKLKQLMPMCWQHDPARRPTFEQICEILDTV